MICFPILPRNSDHNTQTKMKGDGHVKKISSKALLIIGLIVVYVNPSLFAAFLFPNMSGDFGILLFFFFECLGVVLFTLALAKKRLEKGKVKSHGLLRALTPAQICLIISMIMLSVGGLISVIENTNLNVFYGCLGVIGVFTSIILAIVRAVIIRYDRKARFSMMKKLIIKNEKETKQDLVNVLNAVLAKRVMIQREEARKNLEHKRLYCTKCSTCGAEHPKSEFHLMNDKYYCEECFSKMFELDIL